MGPVSPGKGLHTILKLMVKVQVEDILGGRNYGDKNALCS